MPGPTLQITGAENTLFCMPLAPVNHRQPVPRIIKKRKASWIAVFPLKCIVLLMILHFIS
jgi:hypothetical protein